MVGVVAVASALIVEEAQVEVQGIRSVHASPSPVFLGVPAEVSAVPFLLTPYPYSVKKFIVIKDIT